MKGIALQTLKLMCLLYAIPFGTAVAEENCDDGTLWEPYSEICADVRDRQQEFWDLAIGQSVDTSAKPSPDPGISKSSGNIQANFYDDFPVPGRMSVGTAYSRGYLEAIESGRLHTRMFVHPDGLGEDSPLPLFFMPATTRIHKGLEFCGVYSSDGSGVADGLGRVALFAWTCVPGYPCPNGSESPRWQWFIRQSDLPCHITHDVDEGGHANKMLYYANHTDKLMDGTPPLWRSALYLWNYCDAAWDLAWEHEYRQEKQNCSIANQCAFWGPAIETFSTETHPRIAEIGYEDSLLYHDGTWSELPPPETGFWDLDTNDPLPLWQVFHRDPNRSWGVGNFVNENDPPSIEGQADISTLKDQPVEVNQSHLVIVDPDVDPAYHSSFELTLYAGDNYTFSGTRVTPARNFTGTLTVPVTVSDGAADSSVFNLKIEVLPAIRIEAEDMRLVTYRTEMLDFASNDALINLKGPGFNGSAATAFDGPSGQYDIFVVYHDENDGIGMLTVSIAGVAVDSWILDQRVAGGQQPVEANRFTRQIATDFSVNNDDEIRIDGLQGNWDHANVDYIEFRFRQPPAPSPVRMEAEAMQLVTYRIEAPEFASGGALINLKGPGIDGSAQAPFPGASGQYDVSVVYHDENDGVAELMVSIAGVSVDSWALDRKIPGGQQPEEFNRFTRQIATGITVNNGDVIRIDGLQGNWDHANVDYVEFAPTP